MENKTIVVWFSCGAASAVAAKKTIDLYGQNNTIMVVNTPVDEEDIDNRRFLVDVQKWLGQEILIAVNEKIKTTSAKVIWTDRKFMSSNNGAPCTLLLKKEARYQFENKHKIDWHVFGFTADEQGRHDRFVKFERENVIPILINSATSKEDCFKIIEHAGIKLPDAYLMGYPNANCIGCVKASGITYWNHVRKTHPEIFEDRAKQSRELGVKLTRRNKKRIFLDELPEDAIGRSMKTYKPIECGIMCETPLLASQNPLNNYK
jgi:hypothetical protein